MGDFIYKHSAVKHFRRLGEAWRKQAREQMKTVKNMERRRAEGEWDQGARHEIRELTCQAEIYERLGKELKELASDVLHNRVGIL